jgi:hypothetical protein
MTRPWASPPGSDPMKYRLPPIDAVFIEAPT